MNQAADIYHQALLKLYHLLDTPHRPAWETTKECREIIETALFAAMPDPEPIFITLSNFRAEDEAREIVQ